MVVAEGEKRKRTVKGAERLRKGHLETTRHFSLNTLITEQCQNNNLSVGTEEEREKVSRKWGVT